MGVEENWVNPAFYHLVLLPELIPKTREGGIDWACLPPVPPRPVCAVKRASEESAIEIEPLSFGLSMQATRPEFQGLDIPLSSDLVRIVDQMEIGSFHAALARSNSKDHDREVVDVDQSNKRSGWPNWAPEFVLLERVHDTRWRVAVLEIAKVSTHFNPQVFLAQRGGRIPTQKRFYAKLDQEIRKQTSVSILEHYLQVMEKMGGKDTLKWQYLTVTAVK